ncbi:Hypothetical predicted protein [Paramuricea clavata]|uniref:Uncharacterized protein n=1 Tax=Paramuricea clavata TaxID=317549 RepID=A0A7D9DUR1_PARCT|nr:Hypothetical predicted protein [Paramuricea clavata]
MMNDSAVVVSTNETHTYSSLWNIRAYFSISCRKQRVKAMIFLLLLCGDIETCPGPSNCCNCQKIIRSNQSNISCNDYKGNPTCVCSEYYESNMAASGNNNQLGEGMSDDPPALEELLNLVSSKGIKLLHQNICGLATKYPHIEFILKNYKDIHMFTLSETHLHEENIQLLPSIPGYSMVYRNRTNGNFGGGVAAFIADRVQWLRRHDLESPHLECLWIEVLLKNTKGFLIGTLYRPPNGSKFLPKDFPAYFDDMLTSVAAENKEVILMGDINCNFLKKSNDADIKSIIDVNGLEQMVKDPTRITPESSTLIDVICTNKPQNISKVEVISASLSDHEMIGCVRKLNNHSFKARTIEARDYRNYNHEDLCNNLRQSSFDSVFASKTVESAWENFKHIFLSAVDKYAPLIRKKIRGRPCPWLRNETKREMAERDWLLKKARKSNAENDWSKYKRKRNRVNNLVKMNKNRYYKDLLKENSRNPKKFWSTIKEIFPNKSAKCTGRSFHADGKLITHSNCIANAFGSFFSTVVDNLKRKSRPLKDFVWGHRHVPITQTNLSFQFIPVTEHHIEKKLNQLKRSKAAGIDNIPPGILKDCSTVVKDPLAHIINMSLCTGVIPSEWKVAKVIPVHKKGPINDFDNYRPISILPAVTKVMERIVHDQLMNYLEINHLINDSQFGFRPKRSTQLAVTLLLDKVRANMDKGLLTGMVFIDLSKAFDTVSHSNLLNKLTRFGIKSYELEWFTNYLFNRSQCVSFDGSLSEKFKVTSGVPQGSILGPLLFILYINDIDDHLISAQIINAWKLSEVIPLLKEGDHEIAKNNRPISLLLAASKICERVVLEQFTAYVEQKKCLSVHQSGNRKLHSTETLNLFISDKILKSMDDKEVVAVILLDLSKAFDSINHVLLLKKLQVLGVSDDALCWFKSYLTGRQQVVRIGSTVSETRTLNHGVPQGSILGPMLFNIYINDLPMVPKNGNLKSYVDDSKLLLSFSVNEVNSAAAKLNEDLRRVVSWCSLNSLLINPNKTKLLVFATRYMLKQIPADFHILLLGKKLFPVTSATDLGVTLDSGLTEIPTKLDDFLEFQWKQGVEFLSHQPGYLDVASLLSCLHQLKHENVKLEARLTDLVKRRDHLLLVNSRLSKPSNLSAASSPSLTQDVKRAEIASPNVLESSRNSSLERNNQALSGKSPENGPSEVDALPKDGQEQTAKQQDLKIQSQTKEQLTTKKEQQQQRQRTHSDLPQTVKESSQQILDKKILSK